MDVGQLSSGTIRVLVGAGLILLGVVAMGSHSALLGLALFIGGALVIWSVLDAGKQKEVLRAYQAMVQGGEPLHLAQLAQSLGMEQEEAKRCLIELSRRKQIRTISKGANSPLFERKRHLLREPMGPTLQHKLPNLSRSTLPAMSSQS